MRALKMLSMMACGKQKKEDHGHVISRGALIGCVDTEWVCIGVISLHEIHGSSVAECLLMGHL